MNLKNQINLLDLLMEYLIEEHGQECLILYQQVIRNQPALLEPLAVQVAATALVLPLVRGLPRMVPTPKHQPPRNAYEYQKCLTSCRI